MLWLFRKVFERIQAKLLLTAAAKVDAEMDIELGYCRAELLRVAAELGRDAGSRSEIVVDSLRRRAERLGEDSKGPASDVVELVELLRDEHLSEDSQEPEARKITGPAAQGALPSPAEKKRGRPRKYPETAPGNEEALG